MGLVTSLFCTLLITVLFILALRSVAISIGLVDTPGGEKPMNIQLPLLAGLPCILGYFLVGYRWESYPL